MIVFFTLPEPYYLIKKKRVLHPYHLVDFSILPFLLSFSVFFFVLSLVFFLHKETYQNFIDIELMFNFFLNFTTFLIFYWFYIVIKESKKRHNLVVKNLLKSGFILFIVSEVLFFFSFFWAYFYNLLSPSIFIGSNWPSITVQLFFPFYLPLINTLILLNSGLTLTAIHNYIENEKITSNIIICFNLTLLLGFLFLYNQFKEFTTGLFAINDGIYGSCFYMITGLHGFHVIIGFVFIFINFIRFLAYIFCKSILQNFLMKYRFLFGNLLCKFYNIALNIELDSRNNSTGLMTSAWYWHFVDIVWIYVFIFIYIFPYIINLKWLVY